MKLLLTLFISISTLFLSQNCFAYETNMKNSDIKTMKELLNRVIPDYAKYFKIEKLQDCKSDIYELESKGNKIIIRGNNANSMAVALNHYLKYYCLAEYSWFRADKLDMPATLPKIFEKVRIEARCANRFFLNYCTYGYTMPWWNWEDWQHFIDWMAMNGVNLPLAITGQESVWYKVWTELGLSDEEVRSYFTGPAHLPWHRMQNIDYWGGPLPNVWLQKQEELQKKILKRERELNMRPILPAFSGHVPKIIEKIYPNAKLSSLGDWAGFPEKDWCWFLDPMDPLYSKIQKMFLEKEIEIYGTDHVYGLDLFNEMQPPSWDLDYLDRVSRQVYESLAAVDNKAVWFQMAWLFYNERKDWTNDRVKSYITAFPKEKQILLDYYCERQEVWQRTEKFFGVPYIWCYLGNFGGNTMLAGNIDEVNKRLENTYINGGENFSGIGSTLEGFDCNPFMYEYIFEKAWNMDIHKDIHKWIEKTADQRAGKIDRNFRKGWKLLTDSIYTKSCSPGQGVIVNARPSFKIYQYYIRPNTSYNNTDLVEVLNCFLSADNIHSRAYGFDVVNVMRQILSNYFGFLYIDYCSAYKKYCETIDTTATIDCVNNLKSFNSNSNIENANGNSKRIEAIAELKSLELKMIEILDDLNDILGCDNTFLVGKWISDARAMGDTNEEKDYFESNARNLITTWGGRDATLGEYASRTWNGLTETYYGYRWKEFFKEVDTAISNGLMLNESAYRERMADYETSWWQDRIGSYSAKPENNGIETVKALYPHYKNEILKYHNGNVSVLKVR